MRGILYFSIDPQLENRDDNRISSIKDKDGNFLNSHEEIEVMLVRYFSDIAKEHNSDRK